jgi:hypothetical protein
MEMQRVIECSRGHGHVQQTTNALIWPVTPAALSLHLGARRSSAALSDSPTSWEPNKQALSMVTYICSRMCF